MSAICSNAQCPTTISSNSYAFYGGTASTITFAPVPTASYYQVYMVISQTACSTIPNCNPCEEGHCRLITPSFTSSPVTLTAYNFISSGQTYNLVLVARNSLGQVVCRTPFSVTTPQAACFSVSNLGATFSNVSGSVITNIYWTTNNFIAYKVIVDGALLAATEPTYTGSLTALIPQGTHSLQVIALCHDGEKPSATISFTVPAPSSAPSVVKPKGKK